MLVMKKFLAYGMSALVLIFMIIAILSIWEVIQVEDVMWRSVKTLLVIFVASAIVMFIFQLVGKEESQ